MVLCGRALIFWMLGAGAFAQSVSLTEAQRKKLAELVRTDQEAKSHFESIRREADAALKDEPNPIEEILTEGKLKTDPIKIKTHQALEDMRKLHALGWAYAVTENAEYGTKIRQFVLAWARVNKPRDDPIDETNLDPLFIAYDLGRARFSEDERRIVDGWLRQTAAKLGEPDEARSGNHQSHRLKVAGLIAFLLQDKPAIEATVQAYMKLIEKNLHPDGSTQDYRVRDALHYHCYDLAPLLLLAIAARQNGIDLYGIKTKSGASLGRSVQFLVPFCEGKQTHKEFVHSNVAFDRERAEAGEEEYRAGRMWEPAQGRRVLELAVNFDAALTPLLAKIIGSQAARYPTWEVVLKEARSP